MVLSFLQTKLTAKAKGYLFEQRAKQFLIQQGLTFLAQNQSVKGGELDLIMQDNQTVVFVEVRYRQRRHFGSALESIDFRKQQKWQHAANVWLAQQYNQSLETANCRFDVVVFEGKDSPLWIKNFLG
ncbi:MAG: YraN family protein [Pasteurellaceae bacterium]|nr:YraN family protein [Pasteurellaceae bacterium]